MIFPKARRGLLADELEPYVESRQIVRYRELKSRFTGEIRVMVYLPCGRMVLLRGAYEAQLCMGGLGINYFLVTARYCNAFGVALDDVELAEGENFAAVLGAVV